MAVQGKTIGWSNYTGAVSASWRSTYDSGKAGDLQTTRYVYAPAFEAQVNVYGSGLWGAHNGSLTVYYLNSSGGWTKAWSDSCSEARGSGSDKAVSFFHNYNGGSSGDVHDAHTWKVVIWSSGDGNGRLRIWAGGIEMLTPSWYHTYCVPSGTYGRQIRGISGGISSSSYETTGSRRGTLITEASGNYKWICN